MASNLKSKTAKSTEELCLKFSVLDILQNRENTCCFCLNLVLAEIAKCSHSIASLYDSNQACMSLNKLTLKQCDSMEEVFRLVNMYDSTSCIASLTTLHSKVLFFFNNNIHKGNDL